MAEIMAVVPWGPPERLDPNLGARVFAWLHFRAGHHYTVTESETGVYEVECDCGDHSESASLRFPRG